MNCPLCLSKQTEPFFKRNDPTYKEREYYLCSQCALIFLNPAQRLDAKREKERYDIHRNHPDDQDYIAFLRRLTDPLIPKLKPGAAGLDFGCGPGPAVSRILMEAGFGVSDYDPFYYPDEILLEQEYDFITATEVFEHLFTPGREIDLLSDLLKPGGVLAVMTTVIPQERFAQHWYHRDPTHVSFYQIQTFEWIARRQDWILENPAENIILFSKPPK